MAHGTAQSFPLTRMGAGACQLRMVFFFLQHMGLDFTHKGEITHTHHTRTQTCSFFHSAGLQVAALGAVGRADDAVGVFSSFINSGFGNVRGWAQQLYWGTHGASDTLVLGDPLNTALLSVWGLLQAGFGVEPTLGGLRSRSKPAASFEGAGYNMTYMGAPVCLYVQGGETRFCSSGAAVPPI